MVKTPQLEAASSNLSQRLKIFENAIDTKKAQFQNALYYYYCYPWTRRDIQRAQDANTSTELRVNC